MADIGPKYNRLFLNYFSRNPLVLLENGVGKGSLEGQELKGGGSKLFEWK
jgi:hypothetical protein